MSYILVLIGFSWMARTLKAALFWIYLWQLKEYHIGRFLDHFRTHKGKKIFLNYLFLFKIFLLALVFFNFILAAYLLAAVYIAEVFSLALKRKNPIFTFKTVFLILICFVAVILFWIYANNNLDATLFTAYLLFFDMLSPFIFSLIILLFQPFFVLARNRILEKAKKKILGFKNLTVIGITGSYGKTSTKEFLTTILSSKFKVLATKEHKNSEMGIAETILKELKPEHEILVVEMGAYKKGGIKLLCDIVKPSIGIVTGVNEQHFATFGSMENLLSAEGGRELLDNLPNNGLLLVNGDNKYCLDLYKRAKTIGGTGILIPAMVYTLSGNKVSSNIWAKEITVDTHYLDFVAMTREKDAVHFKVGILGRQNIQNLLGAILVARELGMSLEEISLAAEDIKQEQAGITLKKGVHGINIINSSYSSNPDGVIADLDYLNVFLGKKVIIMPCLIELGRKSADIHQQIGRKIAEVCDMAIITTKDKFEDIKKSAVDNGMNEKNIIFSEKPKEIFNLVTTFCKEGDAVLLEGRVPNELIKLLAIKEKPNKSLAIVN